MWICRLPEKSALQRLTMEGRNRYPIWSPDGTRVAFQSDRGGEQAIYVQRVDGTGRPERLAGAQNGESLIPDSWSPDGRSILLSLRERLGVFALDAVCAGWQAAAIGCEIAADDWCDILTGRPLDRILIFRENDRTLMSPDRGVFVQPFPPTGAIYQAPKVLIDFHPVWSPDGRELMYIPALPQLS